MHGFSGFDPKNSRRGTSCIAASFLLYLTEWVWQFLFEEEVPL